jgi:hypothetical protein
MMLALLVVGIALGVLAAFVLINRTSLTLQPVLAGEDTGVGLADLTAETPINPFIDNRDVQPDWHVATVAALSDAEELLDTLESHGYAERELVVMSNSCFAVRWR